MSQKGVCRFSRKMIVILHKILFNGSISDHKNTFYDFFSGVQYVSPTFKAGSLVCDTQHLLWQSVLTIYTYRIRSTLSQTWSQINIPIIWFLNLFNSKKGQYIFERHKNWDCNSSKCKKKSTKKPILFRSPSRMAISRSLKYWVKLFPFCT